MARVFAWVVLLTLAPGGTSLSLAAGGLQRALNSYSDTEHPDEDFAYDIPRPVKVVLWTTYFPDSAEWTAAHAPANCTIDRAYDRSPLDWGVVTNRSYDLSDVDVLVVNVAAIEHAYILPTRKVPGQLWIASCWEPTNYGGRNLVGDCSKLTDVNMMSRFDGVASYDDGAMFPSFFAPPPEEVLRRPAPDFGARGPELATYTSSDCRFPWREEWANKMMAAISAKGEQVLSFGSCEHNSEEPSCQGPEAIQLPPSAPGALIVEETLGRYANRCASRPFALVAENSHDVPWYVSEKIWNALAVGAVPVYAGTADVKHLIPPDSAILASDYVAPEVLADTMSISRFANASVEKLVDAMLAVDEDGFRRLRAWKDLPVEQWGGWARARRLNGVTLPARLCEAGAHRPAPVAPTI